MTRPAPRAAALARAQRAFQELIVAPHERRKTLAPEPATLLRPLRALSPADSADLYSGMYLARLRECLEQDYPALRRLAGEEVFGELVKSYLARFPSRHYSLNQLGRQLPGFLDGAGRFPRRALLRDVARLECAMSEAFDALPGTSLTPADLASAGDDSWAGARLHLDLSVRLVELAHDVGDFVLAAHRKRDASPACPRKRTWLVVYRKDLVVSFLELTEPMFRVLESLARGEPLARALGAARRRDGASGLEVQVARSFAIWMRQGLFVVPSARP